ncbi:hypothetical protein [Duganella callida]|nr:hypothetical protein [Duganella callida]
MKIAIILALLAAFTTASAREAIATGRYISSATRECFSVPLTNPANAVS